MPNFSRTWYATFKIHIDELVSIEKSYKENLNIY